MQETTFFIQICFIWQFCLDYIVCPHSNLRVTNFMVKSYVIQVTMKISHILVHDEIFYGSLY